MLLKIINYIKNHALKERDFVLDLVLPKHCVNCGKEGEWLCNKCQNLLKFKKQYCFGCKIINQSGKFCVQCKNQYSLDGILIAGDYDNKILAELIKKLKYHFAKDISKILAQFLKDFILDYKQENNLNLEDFILIPVPLHKKRENFRGFNQSEEIVRYFASFFNLKINKHNLIKIKNTKAQAKLNEEERRDNIKNSFLWKGNNLKNQNIILVDDVATTGATLNECALVLKENGARKILGLVVAKG
jgi:ComF family protein